MDTHRIGLIVRQHRKAAGLSRVDLARVSGVGKTTIYDIEHGKDTVQLRSLLLVLSALSIEIHLESRVMDSLKDATNRDALK